MARVQAHKAAVEQVVEGGDIAKDRAKSSPEDTSIVIQVVGGGTMLDLVCDSVKEAQAVISRLYNFLTSNRGGWVYAGGRVYMIGTGIIAVICPMGMGPTDAAGIEEKLRPDAWR